MSTPNTYGLTSVTYGTPALTGFVVQTSSVSTKAGVAAEIFDESGKRVHARYDDLIHELSLEMIVNAGTLPVVGGTLTYDSNTYEVTGVDIKKANKDFVKVSVKAKSSSAISYT